ncbi:MAG: phosphate ABC transporter substrate-binding protein PstS [Cyanobacteria bacterium P01_H01_bin.121]
MVVGKTWSKLYGLYGCLIALLLVSCQPKPTEVSTIPDLQTSPTLQTQSITLTGAGASFPYIIYQRWFEAYNQQNPDVLINYQPIGSAAGIQQIITETVDFGASDIAMTDAEMAQVPGGVVLLPMTAGSVAIAYNVPGAEDGLRLPRDVYPRIFLGDIINWNDPAIVAANPDLELPDLPIILVHRSDGSGTTAVFSSHLSAISPAWDTQVGSGLNLSWPAGVGVKSNAGVSAQVLQAPGAIGYVEFSYAQQLEMPVAALENQAGNYVQPSLVTTAAALADVELPADLRVFVPDPPGADAYPIATYSWLLAYQQYEDANLAANLKAILKWSLTEGQQFSEELGYVPLPKAVVERTMAAVESIQP